MSQLNQQEWGVVRRLVRRYGDLRYDDLSSDSPSMRWYVGGERKGVFTQVRFCEETVEVERQYIEVVKQGQWSLEERFGEATLSRQDSNLFDRIVAELERDVQCESFPRLPSHRLWPVDPERAAGQPPSRLP